MNCSKLVNKKIISLGLLLIGLVLLFYVSFSRKDFFLEHFENFERSKTSLIIIAFVIILIGYGLIFFSKIKLFSRQQIFYVGLLMIICFISPPFMSRDVGAYLIGAKNLLFFHVNPYLVNLDYVRSDFWVSELGPVWWLKHTYVYGPVFLIITAITIIPNFLHLLSAVYSYKVFVFFAYIISVYIFSRIVKKLSLNNFLVFLFAINPAILINGLLDGHNEIFLICMLLFSIYFLMTNEGIKSYFFWLGAVFSKYNMLIFLPIFWKKNSAISLRRIIYSGLFVIVAMSIILYFLYSNLDIAMYNFLNPEGFLQNCLYRCSPIVSITDLMSGNLNRFLRLFIFLIAYLYELYLFIIKGNQPLKFVFWAYLTLIFTLVRLLTPWYVLPIIPIGLLIEEEKYKIPVFLLTAYSLLNFFGLF